MGITVSVAVVLTTGIPLLDTALRRVTAIAQLVQLAVTAKGQSMLTHILFTSYPLVVRPRVDKHIHDYFHSLAIHVHRRAVS